MSVKILTLEQVGKAMRESKSISIAMMGLVSSLFSMTPIPLAKDRDDTPRGKAAYVTFVPIDFPGAHDTAALDINSAGEIVGRFTDPPGPPPPPPGGAVHGFLRNRFGQFTIPFIASLVAAAGGVASIFLVLGISLAGAGAVAQFRRTAS